MEGLEPNQPLYRHMRHPRIPISAAALHRAELASAGFNQRLAIRLSKIVSTMPTAYLFAILAFIGLFGLLGWLNPFVYLLAMWISQQFLQLVFLPILAVSSDVLSRKTELQAETQFRDIEATLHDIEEIQKHLIEQDKALLTILSRLALPAEEDKNGN